MDCLFCKIVDGQIPNYTICESNNSIAFLDIQPLSNGHTVVIPKTHGQTILDLESSKVCDLFELVKETTKKIEDTLSPDGFTIGINMRESAGQAIQHLHVHIIPRWEGDGGGNLHSIMSDSSSDSVEDVYKIFTTD